MSRRITGILQRSSQIKVRGLYHPAMKATVVRKGEPTWKMSYLVGINGVKQKLYKEGHVYVSVQDQGKETLQDDALYFTQADMDNISKSHEDPLVIEADIGPNSN